MALPELIAAYESTGATILDAYTILQQRRFAALTVKSGYHKIINFCQVIRQGLNVWGAHNLQWVWVDTCCIDKSSSSELSEAINSMFRWYQDSHVCLAYLSDVPSGADHYSPDSAFRRSEWFTRGWTLQELLAPQILQFYGSDWRMIADTTSEVSIGLIAEITGIRSPYLRQPRDLRILEGASISERMSWASNRKTTRPEDIAYWLLGIFDVHMPMLYGEGEHAFMRLQEIIKKSTDQTIFAWGFGMPLGLPGSQGPKSHQLLAPSPAWFAHGAELKPFNDMGERLFQESFQLTNKGLNIPVSLYRCQEISSLAIYIIVLYCSTGVAHHRVGLYVEITWIRGLGVSKDGRRDRSGEDSGESPSSYRPSLHQRSGRRGTERHYGQDHNQFGSPKWGRPFDRPSHSCVFFTRRVLAPSRGFSPCIQHTAQQFDQNMLRHVRQSRE